MSRLGVQHDGHVVVLVREDLFEPHREFDRLDGDLEAHVRQLRCDVLGNVERIDVRVGQRQLGSFGARVVDRCAASGSYGATSVRSSYQGSEGGTGPPMTVPKPLNSCLTPSLSMAWRIALRTLSSVNRRARC